MEERKGKRLNGKKLKENKLKKTERKTWEPFCLVSSRGCVLEKDTAWNYKQNGQDVTTYVYLLGNDRSKPTHKIAISKKPEISFGNDMMAIIYAHTTRGYVVPGDQYYVGSMVLGESSLFVQVDPEWDPFDGFTIFIVCYPKKMALETRPENESDKKRCGPFLMC